MEKKLYTLEIKEKFKNLIPPLTSLEYEQLEENIIKNGCREPICIWNETIIDGHNRYEICHKNEIPFFIQEVPDIGTDEEAVVWICANQLGRRNLSEESRKMLIGERYNAELIVNAKKNNYGHNQYSVNKEIRKPASHATAEKIAKEYNISEASVRRYAQYSKVMNTMSETNPELFKQIKDGYLKFTREEISKMAFEQKTQNNDNSRHKRSNAGRHKKKFQIKEVPEYSPNVEFDSLAHTIPSWQRSIDRVLSNKDINNISYEVKTHLKTELEKIKFSIETMLCALEEKDERI
ncbi:hypothetical protein J6O48_12595 [bacterium]|nr:hypothetical protein [bacterium]